MKMKNKFILGLILMSVLTISIVGIVAQEITGELTAKQVKTCQSITCPASSNPECCSADNLAIASAGQSQGISSKESTGIKTSSSASAKRSSGSVCPSSMTGTTSADGVPCCIPNSKTTGRFLGFMFRD